MKKYLLLISFLNASCISIYPMEQDWATFKGLPTEIKFVIFDKLLDDPSLNTIINSFNALELIDKEFYNIVKNENKYNRFIELYKMVNSLKGNIFNIYEADNAQFLVDSKFLFDTRLAAYLHTKFNYLPISTIQAALNVFSTTFRNEFKSSFSANPAEDFDKAIRNVDLTKVLVWLALGAPSNRTFVNQVGHELMLESALSYAVQKKNFALVKLLLDKNAKIYLNDRVRDPFIAAVKVQDISIVQLLLQYGVDFNRFLNKEIIKSGDNPFEVALNTQNIPLLQLLIEQGHANLDFQLSNGFSLLLNAAVLKNKELINSLIKHGAPSDDKFLQKQVRKIRNARLTAQQKIKWREAYEFLKDTIEEYNETNAQPKRKKLTE